MKEYLFKDLIEGKAAVIETELTNDMLESFSGLSGDLSSIHTSGEFAKESGFKGRVVHGLLLGAIASRLIGMELPGKYGILHTITLNFHKPCYVGDKITLKGEISDISEAVKAIVVKIKIIRDNGDLAVTGRAQIGVTK